MHRLVAPLIKTLLFLSAAAITLFASSCSRKDTESAPPPAEPGRVLILGIDGLRRDVFRQLLDKQKLPHMAALAAEGTTCWNMEAGGDLNGRTRQPTISGPSWATILTGVFLDKHNLPDNNFKQPRFDQYPHFFKRIRDARPSAELASICTWHPINTKILAASDPALASICINSTGPKGADIDAVTRDHAVNVLTRQNPAALFVHFDDVDHAGHSAGYSPGIASYLEAIVKTDACIGDIVKALRQRPGYAAENWLIILTTDHGGQNKGHGGQTPGEREILTIFTGGAFAKNKTDTTLLYQDAIAPTALKHLGITIAPEWSLESAPRN